MQRRRSTSDFRRRWPSRTRRSAAAPRRSSRANRRFTDERARREGTLTVRVPVAVPLERDVTAARLAEYVALRDSHRDRLLSFWIAKGILDGTVDGHTAAMFQPYADRPADTGLPMWEQQALDAFAHAARTNATTERRHRIEHAELPAPEDLPRLRALGVIASTQPMFA